jgi:tRNA dimethylallyltransferase
VSQPTHKVPDGYNLLVVLGPTASGKTALGVGLAHALGGAVISADSRQVYQGLDIGSGKDLDEYVVDGEAVPYHCIDITTLKTEFSVFHYQRAFFEAFASLGDQAAVVVGGTGLYLEAVLKGYRMVEVPEDLAQRASLESLSDVELAGELLRHKPKQHNTTDLKSRDRAIRAIEIALFEQGHPPEATPEVRPLVLGALRERKVLRQRIDLRLRERLEAGMIEEVAGLHEQGHDWERLERLGLEYRFIAQFLQGQIKNRNDLRQKLGAAIHQFAKRQDTWFRRMERNGLDIQWIPRADLPSALALLESTR